MEAGVRVSPLGFSANIHAQLYLCNFLEANMHNVFLDFLYFILSVSCVCHHQQTSAEIPISQQACGLGIKRSRSKKIHSSINVAKDCLLTGQEQACSRITWLFGCLVFIVRYHAENGWIRRKIAVDCALMIKSWPDPNSLLHRSTLVLFNQSLVMTR